MRRKISLSAIKEMLKQVFTIRWNPNKDLMIVVISLLLVTAGIALATRIIGQNEHGGMAYFIIYAVLSILLCGISLPVYWTVVARQRPLSDLGMSKKWLHRSHFIQLIFALLQFVGLLGAIKFPPLERLLPLMGLALFIGFFEAIFWRGWVQTRLEASLGIAPAVILSAVLYALHYLAYGSSLTDLLSLFFAGVLYGIVFRLTRNVLIIWPIFQPMRLLVNLISNGTTVSLPLVFGLFGVWCLILGLIRCAGQYAQAQTPRPTPNLSAEGN